MSLSRSHAIASCAALLLAMTTVASADVVLKVKGTYDLDTEKPTHTQGTMFLAGENMAMKMDGKVQEHEAAHVVFRGDRQAMYLLDDVKKECLVFDKAEMQKLSATMNSAMSQMEEQLKNLPPEQRAQIEAMMKKNPAAAQPAKARREAKPTGERKSISGFNTQKYDIYWDGKKTGEVWAAEASSLGLSKDDLRPFEAMSKFFEEMMSSLSADNQMFAGFEKDNPFGDFQMLVGGVPIMTRDLAPDGTIESEFIIESIAKTKAAAKEFEVPAEYATKSLMEKAQD